MFNSIFIINTRFYRVMQWINILSVSLYNISVILLLFVGVVVMLISKIKALSCFSVLRGFILEQKYAFFEYLESNVFRKLNMS